MEYGTLPIYIFTFFWAINSHLFFCLSMVSTFYIGVWDSKTRNEAVHDRLEKRESENKLVVS